MMKHQIKITCAIVLFALSFSINASHVAGGTISYRYIGDSTNINNQYRIELKLFRDASGITMPTTQQVSICSSCSSNINITLPLVAGGPGSGVNSPYDCVNPSASGVPTLEYYVYRKIVTLPTTCANWIFSWEACCRNPSISNITAASSQAIYLYAFLNNTFSNNTSSKFPDEIVRAFRVQNPVNMSFTAINPDNDSVFYSLVSPKASVQNCNNFVSVPFAMGYTAKKPFAESPTNPSVFDSINGNYLAKPTATGLYQISVRIEEYKYNNVTQSYALVARVFCDVPIIVTNSLSAQAMAGTSLDYTNPSFTQNPNTGEWTLQKTCNDSAITLEYATDLDCSTLAADGSDFWILDPNGNPLPVSKTEWICASGKTRAIQIQTFFPFAKNGRHVLRYKTGNDGNTVGSYCGIYANIGDSIVINVSGCSGIGIDENEAGQLAVFPNPSAETIRFSINGISESMSYQLFDISGRLLQQGFSNELDISMLPKAVYVITLEQNEYAQTFKILKI
jgi:hypothetical protein